MEPKGTMGERVERRIVPPRKRYRCRYCGVSFAGLPVTQEPNGATLSHRLSYHHPDQVGPYLQRLEAGEDIADTAAEAYEVIEGQDGTS
jgi:hypothetical protein